MPIFPGPPIPQANPDGSIPVDGNGSGSGDGNPNGFQSITPLTVATKLTVPVGTVYAVVSPAVQAVSWRDDGVAPTATVGIQMAAGSSQIFEGASLLAVEFIAVTSGAILNISYYT